MKKTLIIALACLCLVAALGFTYQRPRPVEWEYNVIFIHGDENKTRDTLNFYGRGGWELVAVTESTTRIGDYNFSAPLYHFKKPRS